MKALEAWRPFQPIDKISMNTFSTNLCMMTTCNFIKCVITINIHINLCNDTLSIKRLCVCNAKSYLHHFYCLLYTK